MIGALFDLAIPILLAEHFVETGNWVTLLGALYFGNRIGVLEDTQP